MKRLFSFLLILVILALGAFLYFQKSGGYQDVEFIKLEDFKVLKINTFPNLSLQATSTALLNNPNAFGVEVSSTAFDIYIEDRHVSKGNQTLSTTIKAQSDFRLPIDFEIPLGKAGFFKDAKDIISGAWKNQSINLKIAGTVQVNILGIEVNVPFEDEKAYLLKDYLPNK